MAVSFISGGNQSTPGEKHQPAIYRSLYHIIYIIVDSAFFTMGYKS